MSIKLVAIDIDGTLLNSKKEITPEVFSAIQDAKAAGVKIVIATGRPIAGVQRLLEELELNQPDNYVVTFNGGLVQDTVTGQELIKETLTYDDYLDIELLGRKLGVHMHAITKDGIYTQPIGTSASTLFTSPIWSACRFSIVRLKKWLIKKSSNACILMNQKFWMQPLLSYHRN